MENISDFRLLSQTFIFEEFFFSNYMVPQCYLHREEFQNTSEISSFLGNSIEFFPRRLLNVRGVNDIHFH